MPQFLVERHIPEAGRLAAVELAEVARRYRQALAEMNGRVQWLHSFVSEDRFYCLLLAADEQALREHGRRSGLPADRIAEIRHVLAGDERE